jgi:Spy/CpxP family protein refolding chaperone
MKKLFVYLVLVIAAMTVATGPVWADAKKAESDPHHGYHHGSFSKSGHGSGHGHGHGHKSGHGSGHGCMYGHGSGHGYHHGSMMGHGRGCGGGKKPHGWADMTTEQKDLWRGIVASFNKDTLEVRQQLAVRQIELQTLWSQKDVDEARVEKLSDEVADLKARLWKNHDKYVMECRKAFGDKGWECPGHGW